MKKIFSQKILLFLLVLLLLPVGVSAKEQILLEINKKELEVGDEILVTAKLPKSMKLYALTATFSYDQNVFEVLDDTDFEAENPNISVLYNPENHKFGVMNKSGEIDENLFQIHLRVKKDANVGYTNIALTNISSSDADSVVEFEKTTTRLLVTRDASDGEIAPSNSENKIEEQEEEPIKVSTNKPIMMGLFLVGGVLALGVLYLLITKKGNKILIIILVGATVVCVAVASFLAVSNDKKKDVNKDGKNTYEDAEEIIKYLIDMQGTKTEEKKNETDYDINNDGKVDIQDAAGSTEHTTKEVDYKVALSEKNPSGIFVKKGEITFEFKAEVTLNETIQKIEIDGEYYPVTYQNNTYSVTLNTPTKPGVHEFKITKVILANNREVNTTLSIVKEILKEKPYVDMFDVNDEENTFNFQLEDVDNAFLDGTIVVTDIENNKEVINEKIKKENHFHYDFEKETTYTVEVYADYDLDSGELEEQTGIDNFHEEELIYDHHFMINSDYDFKISDVTITDVVEKDSAPVITFKSTNKENYPVSYIIVGDKEYDVTTIREDSSYEVVLTGLNTSTYGKYYIDIDGVVLDNLKKFEREKDYQQNSLTYNVLKHAPIVDNIEITNQEEEKQVLVSYQVHDDDHTMKKLMAVLVDSTDKVLDSQEITREGTVTLSYKGNSDGRYRVKFLSDYNLGTDRHDYVGMNIGEEAILTQMDIYVEASTVTTPFPVKGQPKYTITYKVFVSDNFKKDHDYNELAGVTINGLNYDGNKQSGEYTSAISFTVPSESGVIDLQVDRVKLRKETYQGNSHAFFSVTPHITQIDVLKDKPTIENLEILEEDYDKGTVTFKFTVTTDKGGLEEGEVVLGEQKYPIQSGENEVTFTEVPTDEALELNFYGTYDLDTNTLKDVDDSKNSYTHELLTTVPYGLYEDSLYQEIALTEIEAISKNEDSYFEKKEDITLRFSAHLPADLDFDIAKVIIKNKEYPVEKLEDEFYVTVDGYTTSGIKKIEIEEIVLRNGKKVKLTTPITVSVEVLKDAVTIEDFNYELEENNIRLDLSVKDLDSSLVGGAKEGITIAILDEDNHVIDTLPYSDEILLPLQKDILRYYIKVYATYDLDISKTDNVHYHSKELILEENISLDKNSIELKDILDVTLYTEKDGKTTPVEEVEVDAILEHQNDYFLTLTMNQMPTVYAKIKKILTDNNRLVFILDYEYVTQEKAKEKQDIRIDFGEIKNGIVKNEARPETLESFIERVKNNPDGEFTLTHDFDASVISENTAALIDVDFTGTLNGNGYKIKNLNKPLFNTVNGGTVENIRFENVVLPSNNAKGTIANKAINATIRKVLIDGFTKTGAEGTSGTLFGEALNGTVIEECGITNFTINTAWMTQTIGGVVGYLKDSTIRNTYIVGKMDASWNFVSTFVGNAQGNSILEGNYSKVNYHNGYASHTCGFACGTTSLVVKDNIDLNTLSGSIPYKFVSSFKESTNNYYLVNSGDSYQAQTGVTLLEQDQIDRSLFEKANFTEEIWNLKNVSYDMTPTLNIEKVSKINVKEVGDAYDENKETLYSNLLRLMPFYDSMKIVESAANIPENHLLAQQEILHIIPVDASGNVVTYLTTENPKKIQKIRIVFKNNQMLEYSVRYDGIYDMVASYRISDLKIDYTFNHYVIDSNSQLANNLTNYLASLTYEDNLDKLTVTADSRIYREFYYDVTQKELKEFVLKYLSNSNYTNTSNNEAINDYIEKEIKQDQKLEKILYVYNYFRRFYDVEINGMKLYDLVLFSLTGFNEKMTPYDIALEFLSNDQNFKTSETNTAYTRTLSKYTGLDKITDFLAYLVEVFTDQTPSEWYASQFKGYLVELNVEGRPDIQYTLWDHVSSKDTNTGVAWYNYVLPIATLPENAAYVISTPVQFIIGSQRTYMVNPEDPVQREKFVKKVQSYAVRMKDYYATTAKLITEAKFFNDIHTVQIDKRYAYDENGNLIFQNPETTQEPFHKNFNEVIGQFAYNDYNAATANGAYVIWRVEGVMDGNLLPEEGQTYEYTYHTWSHESAHNIDARLFLKNNGRRFDAGGEDYADSNLMQSFGDGDIVMNLSRHFEKDSKISSNLDITRIDSLPEIWDFYQKLFDTVYILDYLEGQAFLQLSPEEQARLVVQASYPNEKMYEIDDKPYYRNYMTTVYHTIDKDTIQAMNLKTMDDLTKNRLVMYPTVIYSTYIDNRYGGENIYKVRWYQPHNDYGRPDSYSIKWFAYEMLGYAGYEKGYIEYFSNIHSERKTFAKVDSNGDYLYDKNGNKQTTTVDYKTDLMALQTITNDDTMTFDKYKKMRFDEVQDKLEYINILSVDEVYQEFLQALQEDAETVRKAEETAWKQYPGEDKDSENNRNKIISNARKFEKSTEVRRKYFYELKNKTNDFLDSVYNNEKTQTVTVFTEETE